MKLNKTKLTSASLPVILGALLAGSVSTQAAVVLAAYDFTGAKGAPTTTGTGVTANTMTETGGGFISTTTDSYGLQFSLTGADQAAALADGNFASVTISSTNPGEALDLTSLTLTLGSQTSNSGTINNIPVTNTIYLVSDVNGFGSVITGTNTTFVNPATLNGRIYAADDSTSFDLSGAAYQGLASVTFQLHFSDDSSLSNNSFNTNRFKDVTINGDVTVVPEPSVALLGAIGLLGLLRRRRP